MTPTRAQAVAMLDELYSQLPPIECKGRCQDSCVGLHVSELERWRVLDVTGVDIGHNAGRKGRCPALGALGTCTVYEVRPFICRAFGMVYTPDSSRPASDQALMCDYGCVPEGVIDQNQLMRTLMQIEKLSAVVMNRG